MTAANFCIVLNDALPPPTIAAQLLKQLPEYANDLVQYLDRCQSTFTQISLGQSRCLASEVWQLEQAGFNASIAKHNAALALLLASKQQKLTTLATDQPFWLVELVHIAPSRDGAALIRANELDIQPEHSAALLASAQQFCEGTPFTLEPWSTTHWKLSSEENMDSTFASSQLVSRTAVNDWWDQNPSQRAWRRFVNEIQMLYFSHPINHQRQAQQLAPINSLWPIGGLTPAAWQPQPLNVQVYTELSSYYLRQDWGGWPFAPFG